MGDNLLGLDFGSLFPELVGCTPDASIAPAPLDHLHVRHTVGLFDPIRTADIPASERPEDGLPQSLDRRRPRCL